MRGIIFTGAHMALACEIDIAVGCMLKHMSKNIRFISLCSIMAIPLVFEMWHPFLLSDFMYVYSDTNICTDTQIDKKQFTIP